MAAAEDTADRLIAIVRQDGLTDDQRRQLVADELRRAERDQQERAVEIVERSLTRINLGWKAQSIAKEIRAAAGP
jgi:hypothetical protein